MSEVSAWKKRLGPKLEAMKVFLAELKNEKALCPRFENIFRALSLTPFEDVRVVVLGQDPYHTPGVADGLAFSVSSGPLPPSLRNIFKEMDADIGPAARSGSLEGWARQGVLLLNATLTTVEGQAGAHFGRGWEELTLDCVKALLDEDKPRVFVLWGAHAAKVFDQAGGLRGQHQLAIRSAHPSPLSAHRGFFGSRPFSKVNEFLLAARQTAIAW